MRLLLASNALYYPAHGGGERSNRMVMEGLALRGHDCLVLTRTERLGAESADELAARLWKRGVASSLRDGVLHYELNGVAIRVDWQIDCSVTRGADGVLVAGRDVVLQACESTGVACAAGDVVVRASVRLVDDVAGVVAGTSVQWWSVER